MSRLVRHTETIEKDKPREAGMKTLFLSSYGFGNLGDELRLIDAIKTFPVDGIWTFNDVSSFTADTDPTSIKVMRPREETGVIKLRRLVLGGGSVGFMPSIRDILHQMNDSRSIARFEEAGTIDVVV